MFFFLILYKDGIFFSGRFLGIFFPMQLCLSLMLSLVNYNFIEGSEKMRRKFFGAGLNIGTLKPQYSEQVRQTLFVHYI